MDRFRDPLFVAFVTIEAVLLAVAAVCLYQVFLIANEGRG